MWENVFGRVKEKWVISCLLPSCLPQMAFKEPQRILIMKKLNKIL